MPNIYGAARIAKGITQERAADAIPCSVRSLADYESGVRIPPSETVVRMAEIYDAQYLVLPAPAPDERDRPAAHSRCAGVRSARGRLAAH